MASKNRGWSIVVGFILAAMVLGVCVACDDDDDDDSWAPATELVAARHQDHGGDDRHKDGHRNEDYGDGSCKYCPSFKDSPVTICLPGSTCTWGDGKDEQAKNLSLVPPNPQKLVEAIQGGAAAIGKSAGEMAGAVAALPIAILLADDAPPVPVKATPHNDPPPMAARRLPETV